MIQLLWVGILIIKLSPHHWVYNEFKTYVVTHPVLPSSDKFIFFHENPVDLIKKLSNEQGKDIWICKEAQFIQPLLQQDIIDEYHLTIIPILLGSGIRLFDSYFHKFPLKLQKTQQDNGRVNLVYINK